MKVILVDDEPAMHLILRKMLLKLPDVQVAGAFADAKQAVDFLRDNADVELALVDISMPEGTGLEFAAAVGASSPSVQVVFVTSHKEFALEAYDLSVLDYLIKPVSQERLARAIGRARSYRGDDSLTALRETAASSETGRLVVAMLGDVAVRNETGGVKWISRKCAELFAYLLMNRGKRTPRSRLVTDIFGGMLQANAENYLNTTVYQLRKSLEPLGVREAVRSENDGYALELKDPDIDFAEFERQAAALKTIDAGNMDRALQIERIYTGELFGDKAYVWAIHETERLAELHASFVRRIADALLAMNDAAAASKLLLKLRERNPLDESAMRLLLTARSMAGDKKGMTALYTEYVRLLGRELGIRPPEKLILHYDSLLSRMADRN